MNSKYVVYPKAQEVEIREEAIDPPGPGEILSKAEKSLISIATELHCLRGEFDSDTIQRFAPLSLRRCLQPIGQRQ